MRPALPPASPTASEQKGYALIAVVVLVMIVGVMSTSMLDTSDQAQQVSSATIQRNRVFQAIDSALGVAEEDLKVRTRQRLFADANASEGVYRLDARVDQWWQQDVYDGEIEVDPDSVLGVTTPPRYTLEEVGQYISDGGTGIVNLDTGSGSYGSKSNGAREVVLYSLEAYGKGSFDVVQAAAESTVILNR